jgi:hypothetical protein
MSYGTDPVLIKGALVRHRCSWCGDRVKVGESYWRWRWYDGGEATTVKMHPECRDAAIDDSDGGWFEFSLYGNERPARPMECAAEPGVED